MTISTNDSAAIGPLPVPGSGNRIRSIDALRGLVVFTMIFVNYLDRPGVDASLPGRR